jgi:hypothetical protein
MSEPFEAALSGLGRYRFLLRIRAVFLQYLDYIKYIDKIRVPA